MRFQTDWNKGLFRIQFMSFKMKVVFSVTPCSLQVKERIPQLDTIFCLHDDFSKFCKRQLLCDPNLHSGTELYVMCGQGYILEISQMPRCQVVQHVHIAASFATLWGVIQGIHVKIETD